MGTSGSYGGSGSSDWGAAHDAFDALPGTMATGGGGEPPADQQQILDSILKALADALQHDDFDRGRPPAGGYPLASLLPRLGGEGGGGGPGRVGAGSRRQVLKGASRGAAAVAGAYALRNGDAGQLRELGLDLSALAALQPRAQIARILQAILGDAAHPDDTALRKATAKHVKAVVLSPELPSPEESIRGLVAAWIYELALVELGSQQATTPVAPREMVRKQEWLRSWLTRRVRDIDIPNARRMTVQQFSTAAAKVTGEALRMLRARRS
ncbi:hypothetical protein [Streptomyces sp. AK02-01A]|uniref:hypothetical protein n=1 Tax=Streptomyces sp. AK02-01A TaxID=3028648 RepID=UPI0029A6104F|nr:hypothetical protein [Streptomyces sp. AK02-01A]MDX3854228.1 hypothetical protein [Streptomyces sp. AK02-01A]